MSGVDRLRGDIDQGVERLQQPPVRRPRVEQAVGLRSQKNRQGALFRGPPPAENLRDVVKIRCTP